MPRICRDCWPIRFAAAVFAVVVLAGCDVRPVDGAFHAVEAAYAPDPSHEWEPPAALPAAVASGEAGWTHVSLPHVRARSVAG